MANSVHPDQTAPWRLLQGAVWSGFAYAILSETSVYEFLGHLPCSYFNISPSEGTTRIFLYLLLVHQHIVENLA